MVLLSKNYVDYRNCNKEDIIENFTLKSVNEKYKDLSFFKTHIDIHINQIFSTLKDFNLSILKFSFLIEMLIICSLLFL